MSRIPKQHEKYNLLRSSASKNDWECFIYPTFAPFEKRGIYGLDPYGYASVDAYNQMIDEKIRITDDVELIRLYKKLQEMMVRMNNKENWSVLRYKGKSLDHLFGLIEGESYYWPCDIANPSYEGVIDEEEYTSYWYATEPDMWEILEDPTGMAYATIYEKKNYVSERNWNHVMNQVKIMGSSQLLEKSEP